MHIKIFTTLFLCMCVCACISVCVREVRKQPVGVGSLVQPCGFQELNSGCQIRWQVPLPDEVFCWPRF